MHLSRNILGQIYGSFTQNYGLLGPILGVLTQIFLYPNLFLWVKFWVFGLKIWVFG